MIDRTIKTGLRTFVHSIFDRAALPLLGILCIGCGAATTNNPALERAQAAYQRARQDSEVVGRAAVALENAAQTLEQAELLWAEKKDVQEAEHLAYLAEKKVEIARAIARRRLAADEIRQLRAEPR